VRDVLRQLCDRLGDALVGADVEADPERVDPVAVQLGDRLLPPLVAARPDRDAVTLRSQTPPRPRNRFPCPRR
jgi:hypothetical protein